jgi:hypothetical protein
MAIQTKKAHRTRESWYADVDGERLPVVHEYWLKKGNYNDPEATPSEPRFVEFVELVKKSGMVILQKDKDPKHNAKGQTVLMSDGYIAVFKVDFD